MTKVPSCNRGVIGRYMGVILGSYWAYLGVIWGLYGDTGKENGNYYNKLTSLTWGSPRIRSPCPDPLKDPNNGTSQNGSITTLGKPGDYWEAPFFGCFRGSGCLGFPMGRIAALEPLYLLNPPIAS